MKIELREVAQKIACGIARAPDFEAITLDDVQAIKSDQQHPHYRFAEHEVKAAGSEDERTFEWCASTEHVDSMGDIIKVAGWNTDRISIGRMPLLLNHSPEPGPAGLVNRARKGRSSDGTKALFLTGTFHEKDLYANTEFGAMLEAHVKLVKRNELLGSSVGFVPLEPPQWPDDETRKELAMPRWGMVFDGQELLEHSITCLPANRNANRKSMKVMREKVRKLVEAGEVAPEAADLLLDQLELGDEAWLRRMAHLQREVVSIRTEVPWIRGAKAVETPAPTPAVATTGTTGAIAKIELLPGLDVDAAMKSIQDAASKAIAEIVRQASNAVRHEVRAVIREQIEPLEDGMTASATRIEEALASLVARSTDNSQRAEDDGRSVPQGTKTGCAVSTGTSRETPTNPGLSAAETLLRSIDAAASRRTEHDGRDPADRPQGPRG